MAIDLADLRHIDEHYKPVDSHADWQLSERYYEDVGRQDTRTRLKQLGVGLKNNYRPLELSLLRRIIDRLAIVYDQPPTRWLVSKSGRRLPETSARHENMVRVLTRAQYDLAWRRIDKMRALMRQCVIRYYASDAKGSVVLRLFAPYNVMRHPSAEAPDQIEQDERFALRLAGEGTSEVWEYWERVGGKWEVARCDNTGKLVGEQPFGGYPELPVQIVYDEYPGGRAWLSPRGSRTSFVEAANAIANDLWALIVNQAHTDRYFRSDDISQIPEQSGPGTAGVLPKDTDVIDMSPNPKITECQSVLESFIKLWSVSEDLPVDEFLNRQTQTGAALKVSERALKQRREAQALLAPDDERLAYRKLRGVHNLHASAWEMPDLDESTELDIVVGDLAEPIDMRELQEALARSMALGSKSIIDVIQAEASCPRHTAIKIYERVIEDRHAYPAAVTLEHGERDVVDGEASPMPDLAASAGEASVLDMVRNQALEGSVPPRNKSL